MRSVPGTDNILPFRRPGGLPGAGLGGAPGGSTRGGIGRTRAEQGSLMDAVYASGTLVVAAADRECKLVASRLQVYGFLTIEEVCEDGTARRLRPSEAIRARAERPWRLSKANYGAGLGVTIPAVDDFLFDAVGFPA